MIAPICVLNFYVSDSRGDHVLHGFRLDVNDQLLTAQGMVWYCRVYTL